MGHYHFLLTLSLFFLFTHAQDDLLTRVRLALRPSSLEHLRSKFYQISDPKSPHYTHYYTREQMRTLHGTSVRHLDEVQRWLTSLGYTSQVLPSGDVIEVAMDKKYAEKVWRDVKEDTSVVVPSYLLEIIDVVVVDGLQYDKQLPVGTHRQKRLKFQKPSMLGDANPNMQKQFYQLDVSVKASNSMNSQMVWGPGTYGASLADLKQFFTTFNLSADINDVSFPGYIGTPGGDNWGEGTLDAEYIMAFAPGVKTAVFNSNTSQSTEEGLGFGYAFFDLLVTLSQLSNEKLPLVLSLSLGSLSFESCEILCDMVAKEGKFTYQNCVDFMETQRQVCMYDSADQSERINIEMMKLGARGVSILAATGDGGSHFSFIPFDEHDAIGQELNVISCKYNFPTYPAASPYVTGVGGVEFDSSSKPVAWSGSGGGFSWEFPMPTYQRDVIAHYFSIAQSSPGFPSKGSFNETNRAYPDVSAAASDTPIVISGTVVEAGGTSASTPAFAGIISLINDYRLNHQLQPLGFLNVRLYQIATEFPGEAFYDITSGNTQTSCTEGFPATPGWDPTTGFGTPIYPGLLKYLGSDDFLKK